jgi:hypothetical protein
LSSNDRGLVILRSLCSIAKYLIRSFEYSVPKFKGEPTYNAFHSILERINNPNQTRMFNPQYQLDTNKLIIHKSIPHQSLIYSVNIMYPRKSIPRLDITEQLVAAVVLVPTQASFGRNLVLIKMALQITVDVH